MLRNIVLWDSEALQKHRINFLQKDSWRNLGSQSYCRERNTLCILLLAQCQTSQVWLETNTESVCWDALKSCSAIGMSIGELTQMSSPSPSNLPLILLLCCHCRSYCRKAMLWASAGRVSEAERKKPNKNTPRNIPGLQHQVTEIQGQLF